MTDKEPSLHDQVTAAFESHSEPEVIETSHEESKTQEKSSEKQHEKHEKETSSNEDSNSHVEESFEAPAHWAPEDVEEFNELDERGRKLYLKRHKQMEAGYTKKSQSLAEEKKIAERFKQALEPYRDEFKKNGIDEFDAFKRGATAHLRLINSPMQERAALMNQIALQYGVNLAAPPQQNQQNQQQQPTLDPATQVIFDQLNRHNQYLTNLEKQRQNQERYTIEKTISDFSGAKDDKGELKHPHFETIKAEMGHLISTGLASSLEQAYDKAVRLNEDLQQEYINTHYNTMKRKEETSQKTVASKRAGFNVSGRGGSSPDSKGDSLTTRQILAKAYDAQTKRQKI
jgi:hypothetical protein